MEYGVFEARVMELVFKTDLQLTPPLVAFRVGSSVEAARRHLERMVTDEILTMEVDDQGVIYYDLPGRPAPTKEPLSWQPAPGQALAVPAAAAPPTIIMVGAEKSVATAVALSLLFGPLGMLYSTGLGALVMFFVTLAIVPATAGAGLLFTLPAGAIWAARAATEHNQRMQPRLLLPPR